MDFEQCNNLVAVFGVPFRKVSFPCELSPDGCQSECIDLFVFTCLGPTFGRKFSSRRCSDSKLEQT